MNYYQHNIGDYRRDTSHLSLLEHGIYRQLLDWYYLDEQAIPKETQVVMRRLSARTQDEQNAVEIILKEFFVATETGWKHKRCDVEIAAYQEKAQKNRNNGKLGGRPPKTQVVISGLSDEKPNESEQNPNHEPLTNNQYKNPLVRNDVADDCPHKEIIALYHKHLPALTQVRSWTEKRAKQLKARWREEPKRQNLEYWEKLFQYIAESDWLMGRSSEWQADLEWITKSENFVKIIEGKYHKDA